MRFAARVAGTLGAIIASLVFAAPGSPATAVGRDRVLAVLIAYGPQPYGRGTVTQALAEAGAFLRRSSFGKLVLAPTVTPWLEGGVARPDCGGSDRTFVPLRSLAAAAGYDVASYDSVLYIVGGVRCGFYGIEHGSDVLLVTQPDARLVVHELGHTFGLPHAAAVEECASWCVTDEQGDLFSPMGSGFVDFNAYEKEQLGWIPRQPRVAQPGRYLLYPASASGPPTHRALVIETPGTEYWLEQRPDAKTPALIVHIVHPDELSSWAIAPSTLLLAPIRIGHPTIVSGQTFRVPGQFAIKVARRLATPMRLVLTLKATTH